MDYILPNLLAINPKTVFVLHTKIEMKRAGRMIRRGYIEIALKPSSAKTPKDDAGGWSPNPIKDNPDSVSIATGTRSISIVKTIGMILGIICFLITPKVEFPKMIADSTNSAFFIFRTSPLTTLATDVHEPKAIAVAIAISPLPTMKEIRTMSIISGIARKKSISRIMTMSKVLPNQPEIIPKIVPKTVAITDAKKATLKETPIPYDNLASISRPRSSVPSI